jgi:NTP pyrophosphatase (non-canonical NTP hydrolase)
MQIQAKQKDIENRDREMDEELADVLTAISVVSKRLARKLNTLSQQENREENESDPITID